MSSNDPNESSESGIAVEDQHEAKLPDLYRVLMLNDDYTSMEFVVMVLENVFNKATDEATRIMLEIHQKGMGVAGVYTREIAETKISLVHALARQNEFPLKCKMEPE